MEPVTLMRHDADPEGRIARVTAIIERLADDRIALRYAITDPDEALAVPPGKGERRDGLWMRTCLEYFLGRAGGDDYLEFNFAPGGDWAAYRFDRPRQGMRQLLLPEAPRVAWAREGDDWVLTADLTIPDLPANGAGNLTAIIEEVDGTKTHWAALHAPGKPDFHDPHCFAVRLPSGQAA